MEEKEGSNENKEISLKEQRIRQITHFYYSRKDVQKAIVSFCQNRETVPRFFEGFGKRPDMLQYDSDLFELVQRGATSFHCSEEIWSDPLQLSRESSKEETDKIRKGWDLLIDIDCKWIEYSKKAAQAIVMALEKSGVNNIGIKYSGSKGFHILVPSKSFPQEVNGIQTAKMFPEWPRIIVSYLQDLSRPLLKDLIKDMEEDFKNVEGFSGVKCNTCSSITEELYRITVSCSGCYPSHIETFKSSKPDYKIKYCPNCRKEMHEEKKEKFYYCSRCNKDSIKNPQNFDPIKTETDVFKILGLDLQLVSPRHLFRCPYSLHEKTSLVSVVLDKKELETFEPSNANHLKIKIKNFTPDSQPEEAKWLLLEALDWHKSNSKELSETNTERNPSQQFPEIKITSMSEDLFPQTIKNILQGAHDGKKRSLFILLNYFRSLGLDRPEIEKQINEWNKKNNPPLKEGYIKSQFEWSFRNKSIFPPNFSNPIYKDLGVLAIEDSNSKFKNPVNFTAYKFTHTDKKEKDTLKTSKSKIKKSKKETTQNL